VFDERVGRHRDRFVRDPIDEVGHPDLRRPLPQERAEVLLHLPGHPDDARKASLGPRNFRLSR